MPSSHISAIQPEIQSIILRLLWIVWHIIHQYIIIKVQPRGSVSTDAASNDDGQPLLVMPAILGDNVKLPLLESGGIPGGPSRFGRQPQNNDKSKERRERTPLPDQLTRMVDTDGEREKTILQRGGERENGETEEGREECREKKGKEKLCKEFFPESNSSPGGTFRISRKIAITPAKKRSVGIMLYMTECSDACENFYL